MTHGKYTTLEERRARVEALDRKRERSPASAAHAAKMRSQMLAVARKLLNEQGHVSKVSVQEIASYVGTSVGGLYLYFPSVMDLWSHLLKEDLAEFGLEALRRFVPEELYAVIV